MTGRVPEPCESDFPHPGHEHSLLGLTIASMPAKLVPAKRDPPPKETRMTTAIDPRNNPANRRPGCPGGMWCRCDVSTPCTTGDLTAQLDAIGIRVGQPVLIAGSGTSFDGHVGNVTRIAPAPADARSDVKAWVWVDGGPRYGILAQFLRPAVAAYLRPGR